jgi:hypothetical protein
VPLPARAGMMSPAIVPPRPQEPPGQALEPGRLEGPRDGSAYLLWLKQSLQYTGRSPLGLKGTIVSFPHSAQTAGNISRDPLDPAFRGAVVRGAPEAPPGRPAFLAARQEEQRLGSFVNPS